MSFSLTELQSNQDGHKYAKTVECGVKVMSNTKEDKSTCYFCEKRIFGYSKEKGHWDIESHSKEWLKGKSIRVHHSCLTEGRNN